MNNFVFISANFPKTYYQFPKAWKQIGGTALCIGEDPYDSLSQELKDAMDEYYQVGSMQNYDEMYRAVAWFAHKHGKIDWLESNNEYWLLRDAHLRTDFNIKTGLQDDRIDGIKYKSKMKAFYKKAGVPTARYHLVTTLEAGKKFIKKVGYPVVVKPDNGVGAYATYRLNNEDDLNAFYNDHPDTPYIMEEFINGLIVSYDGVADAQRNILFETSHVFPNPIMDVVNDQSSMYYYSLREIPYDLKQAGQACVKAFYTAGRCFHMEFFKLLEDKEGLGKKGDLIGLEVNMRVPGGFTPDMIDFAYQMDIYHAWADVICYNHNNQYVPLNKHYCVYVGRRNNKTYKHSEKEIIKKYNLEIQMKGKMANALSNAMGNYYYIAIFDKYEDLISFKNYILE